jgi:hypothetical protein
MPDPELTSDDIAAIEALDSAQRALIDAQLLSNASTKWRKVAFVVGSAMLQLPEEFDDIPDTFLAQRVRAMVEEGRLESQGNLMYMRFSEVRLLQSG